jgi:uncharacterized protein YaiI (UPF0178 family)
VAPELGSGVSLNQVGKCGVRSAAPTFFDGGPRIGETGWRADQTGGLEDLLDIYVDADACPVKAEIYRVAKRYGLKVIMVSNSWFRVPNEEWIQLVVVEGELDAADDWIVERVTAGDVVISADIPLASRCLQKGALVLGPRGRPFTEDSIGDALATRELLSQLRDIGTVSGGPPPIDKRDRSRFLQRLDEMIQTLRRSV